MDTIKLENLDFEINIHLISIDYKTETGTDTGVKVEDKYKITEILKDTIKLNYKRHIVLDMKEKVTLSIIVEVLDKVVEDCDLTQLNLDKDIEKNIEYLLGPTMAFTSNLISQITSAYGECPFITTPCFCKDKKNK